MVILDFSFRLKLYLFNVIFFLNMEDLMMGMVFNVQRFSLHDGPGIRTTIFLKGCPLRCEWCANPESQDPRLQILYDHEKCVGCTQCVHACPKQALSFDHDRIVYDISRCIGCLTCVHTCPQEALSYEGEEKNVDSLVKECLKDLPFYEESQGGITISGGEGMIQPGFVSELLDRFHQEHLHVAIETTGYIQRDIFTVLAKKFDLLLFDVKHYDESIHQKYTGVSNTLIKENLAWAIEEGVDVLPRIPVIPKFNDSLEDAKGLANLLVSVNAKRVQLLPFHQFGQNKYHLLNREYTYENVPALHEEDLMEYKQVFIDAGIHCFF